MLRVSKARSDVLSRGALCDQGVDGHFSFGRVECLLQVDDRKAQRQIVFSRYFYEFRNCVYVVDSIVYSPKPCFFAWLSFV